MRNEKSTTQRKVVTCWVCERGGGTLIKDGVDAEGKSRYRHPGCHRTVVDRR